ncbi:TolC family protein [Piscinibacter koreensis]|uniref:TolC family protein n=1 Tax=Piscinibacter koreensis TaxID=2742824 RepID=A0A7Y6NT66_9BURK|nr:TolC family protein [Schlegelella koreensis]NUZ08903.1 TolC family protein [Schlegelella koreensis]
MFYPLIGAVALAAALAPPAAEGASLSLETALALATQRSEAARAGRAGQLSAIETARAAGQLPDPTLNVGIDNLPATGPDRLSTTRDSMTMKRVGISQEWLSAGKRAARSAAAEAAVQRESIQVEAALAETRLQTALAYVDAFYAGEALKLTTLMEHHAHEELEAARGRLASSTGGSQEVLALTAARGTTEDESAQVRQEQSVALVTLQRYVGVMSDELLPPPETRPPSEDDYVAAHPSVLALTRDVELARRQAAVTASERDPNWTWGVSYGQRTGYSDMLSFGVSIPIPLSPSQRQDRETAAKLALADKAEAELADATRAALAEYRALASDSQRLEDRIERYRVGVLTPARQRVAAATAAYASNQSSLVTLFEARHAEVDAQRKLLSLRRDLMRARMQLSLKPVQQGAAR